jgi:hypothetical protein
VSILAKPADGVTRRVFWQPDGAPPPATDVLRTALRVRPEPDGPPMNVVVEVDDDGSLESAGRRVKLFGRLMDEFPVYAPPGPPPVRKSQRRPAPARPTSRPAARPAANILPAESASSTT